MSDCTLVNCSSVLDERSLLDEISVFEPAVENLEMGESTDVSGPAKLLKRETDDAAGGGSQQLNETEEQPWHAIYRPHDFMAQYLESTRGGTYSYYRGVRRDSGSVARPTPELFKILWGDDTHPTELQKMGDANILKKHIVPKLEIPIPKEAEYHYLLNPIHWYIVYQTELDHWKAKEDQRRRSDSRPTIMHLRGVLRRAFGAESNPQHDDIFYEEMREDPKWLDFIQEHQEGLRNIFNNGEKNSYVADPRLTFILEKVFLAYMENFRKIPDPRSFENRDEVDVQPVVDTFDWGIMTRDEAMDAIRLKYDIRWNWGRISRELLDFLQQRAGVSWGTIVFRSAFRFTFRWIRFEAVLWKALETKQTFLDSAKMI
ncbi:MAG: hypothetical protein M1831_002787 [Alyxoria varia]|nr:MAG: hypothetical protein M1831_002787 [Alyxoria varia]